MIALESGAQQRHIMAVIQGLPRCKRVVKKTTLIAKTETEIKAFQEDKEKDTIVAKLSYSTIYLALFFKKSNNLSLHNMFHSKECILHAVKLILRYKAL